MNKVIALILSAVILMSAGALYVFAGHSAPAAVATADEAAPATLDEATADEVTADEATADEATSDEATADEATADEATAEEATADEATADEADDEATADEASAVNATDDEAQVYVTISDENGDLVVTAASIPVTDADADGALTVNDTLIITHDLFYEGGSAAGYETSVTQYGLGITKLWGTANGGSYGYYVNHNAAWSLADPVTDGDYVVAFVYTDLVTWSDHYSFFDLLFADIAVGDEITVTYYEAGYDESWNPVTVPVEGAVITVNGEATAVTTDAEGKADLSLTEPGTYLISAAVEGRALVAPVCIVTVADSGIPCRGDVNGDGVVNNRDATILDRYIAGWVGYDAYITDMTAADLSGDGVVNNRDAGILDRYVAGWEGYDKYIFCA